MVHTLPTPPSTQSAFGGDTEKFSGLRISDRQLRANRWHEIMRGKKYIPFDRLSSLESQETGSPDAVMIGVLYEKSLRKTGSNGNPYVHWNFTDLRFPQSNTMTVFLYGQAFDTWEKDAETAVATGSIVAILNPVALASRSSGDGDRKAAKVTYGTQLVRLGVCPSLGYCSCNKKDGLKCSMPCDRDRGPLVCYYHTLQQAAQKTKQWQKPDSARASSSSAPAARANADGIFVLQAPMRPQPNISQHRGGAGGTAKPPPVTTARPTSAQGLGQSLRSARISANNAGGSIDAVTKRLLSSAAPGASKAVHARDNLPGASNSAASRPSRDMKQQTHILRGPDENTGDRPLPSPARVSPDYVRPASADDGCKDSALAKRMQAKFPEGIPEPDPNNPLKNAPSRSVVLGCGGSKSRVAIGRECSAALLANVSRSCGMPASQSRRGWERPQVHAAPTREGPAAVASGGLPTSLSGNRIPTGAKPSALSVERRRAEKEFGRKVAVQLDVADPTKDLVRQRGSRFSGLVEQERVAKRHRHLSELEAQDAMAEKMEAITEISVQAWKCKECSITTESQRTKALCEQQGHSITMVTAKKTRWECKGCSFDEHVLDRELPTACRRCNGTTWKQGPLRRVAKAAMEKDLLLPRGEELPYINSIPGMRPSLRVKEAKDDYGGL